VINRARVCPRCRARFADEIAFCPNDGSALREEEERELVGQVVAGRYRVHSHLGEGGMARVYLAEHIKLGRQCALKVIREGLVDDARTVARFNREAAYACRIMHPNVAAIFDFGETTEGMLFLAMEYVPGEPLSALLARLQRLPPRRSTSIAWQIADALTAAHDLGIVHRDLKPENVMLSRNRDGSDLAKVVDFGVARIVNPETHSTTHAVTSTGVVMGTQDYMSPEQLAGEPVDARTDIYSLGLILVRMLTGHSAFSAGSVRDAFAARLRRDRKQLAQLCPEVPWPATLDAVIDRALADTPGERYQSPTDFVSDLVQAVLEWLPDDDRSSDPWGQRLRYATPVHVRAPFRTPTP
jgi:serine/threonine-protein kinase